MHSHLYLVHKNNTYTNSPKNRLCLAINFLYDIVLKIFSKPDKPFPAIHNSSALFVSSMFLCHSEHNYKVAFSR